MMSTVTATDANTVTPWPPIPAGGALFVKAEVPSQIEASVAEKMPSGYYRLVGDAQGTQHYRVLNRSAPILQQISADVPGMKAVSDTLVFVPEPSLTEANQAVFSNRAMYLDRHRLGVSGMTTTVDEVVASQKPKDGTECVRIDPCPKPAFKDLNCCSNSIGPDAPIEPKDGLPYPPFGARDYKFKDTTWSFMVSPDRPWDRIAMIVMGVSVAVAVLALLIILIVSMIWGRVKQTASQIL